MLTKKEKRSLKKIYQEQKRKDIQEKIKLGLVKPKENKLTYGNMIQLFKNDSILKEEIPTKGIDDILFCTCQTSLRIDLSALFPNNLKYNPNKLR